MSIGNYAARYAAHEALTPSPSRRNGRQRGSSGVAYGNSPARMSAMSMKQRIGMAAAM